MRQSGLTVVGATHKKAGRIVIHPVTRIYSNRRNVDNTNLLGKNENVEVFPVLQLRFGRNDLSDRHPFQRLRYQLFIPFTR